MKNELGKELLFQTREREKSEWCVHVHNVNNLKYNNNFDGAVAGAIR